MYTYTSDQLREAAKRIDGATRGDLAIGPAPEPSGPPQLIVTSERLHYCIEELDGLVSKLEVALDPVLNPDMTAKGGAIDGVSAPEPIRCPIGKNMDARSDEVFAISQRVRSLLERLAC